MPHPRSSEEGAAPTLPAGTLFGAGASGSRAGAWLSWGPGIWGPRSRFGRAASQAHGARRRPRDCARAGTFPTGLAEEGACVTQKPPGVRAGGEAGSGGGTGNFSISVPFERTENCEQGYGPDMCAGAAGGWPAHPSQWPERAGSAAPPPPSCPHFLQSELVAGAELVKSMRPAIGGAGLRTQGP